MTGILDAIQTQGGPMPAFVAMPDGAGPWPGVVVIHDVFGMTDNLRRHAEWLASAGFLAIAPDLYRGANKFACVRKMFRALVDRTGQPFDDIEAVRGTLLARADCTGKVGIVGFCMGGGFALAAAVGRGFQASGVNYGKVPPDAQDFLSGACPIVGSFGGKDPGFKGAAQQLETALADNGVDHDVVEYPEASHGFMDQFSGMGGWLLARFGFGHRPAEAADAQARIVRFFNDHLDRKGI